MQAQDRFATIENKLKELGKETPGLNEKVELSVNGVSIQEFIRGLATSNNLNISVDAALNTKIVNNFSNVTVAEVLLFLCRKYDMDITFIGSIMSFSAYTAPVAPTAKYTPKEIKITYSKTGDLLSFDLTNDSLTAVAKELTKASGKNVVLAPDLNNKLVNGFVQNVSFKNAMERLSFANDLRITAIDDNSYQIEKKDAENVNNNTRKTTGKNDKGKKAGSTNTQDLTVKSTAKGLISVDATATPITDIIAAVSEELKNEYFLFSELKGNATLNISNATYEDFLKHLLNGTDYTFKKDSGIYLIGDRNLEGLRATQLVQLKFRTVEKIIDVIPGDLKKGVELKAFPDLNSVILSGSQPRIDEITSFLRDIDRVVPVIVIEVLIVDVSNTRTVSTGIEAGLGKDKTTTGGKVFPGVDLSFSSNSLNNIIDGINGLGIVNIGKVTPNFYLKLKALEEQGVLKLRSTPKLATLNGHEAKMSIGTTEYYLETSNNVIGSQNPQNIITQQYKSVNADLSITINPIVSGDEQITMDIKVKQSSFTARISPSAPPGTISRDFQSLIRVKNEEMIILGGLEEESSNDAVSGLPLLSRIPVLKWIFSSRTKAKGKKKLTIFIKPTVIY